MVEYCHYSLNRQFYRRDVPSMVWNFEFEGVRITESGTPTDQDTIDDFIPTPADFAE